MVTCGAGDVACSACAGSGSVQSVVHSGQNGRMLPHAQIVIRAPDGDIAIAVVTCRLRKSAAMTFQLGKLAVVPAVAEGVQLRREEILIVH